MRRSVVKFFVRDTRSNRKVSLSFFFFFNALPHGDNGDAAPRYSIFEPFSGYFEYKRLYRRQKRGLYTPLQTSTETFQGGRAPIGAVYVLAEILVTLKRYLLVKWNRIANEGGE